MAIEDKIDRYTAKRIKLESKDIDGFITVRKLQEADWDDPEYVNTVVTGCMNEINDSDGEICQAFKDKLTEAIKSISEEIIDQFTSGDKD